MSYINSIHLFMFASFVPECLNLVGNTGVNSGNWRAATISVKPNLQVCIIFNMKIWLNYNKYYFQFPCCLLNLKKEMRFLLYSQGWKLNFLSTWMICYKSTVTWEEPGLKQVIPVHLNAFCSLLSPKTICEKELINVSLYLCSSDVSNFDDL